MFHMQRRLGGVILLAALGIVVTGLAVTLVVVLIGPGGTPQAIDGGTGARNVATPVLPGAEAPIDPDGGPNGAASSPAAPIKARRVADREAREALVRAIAEARRRREDAAGAARLAGGSAPAGEHETGDEAPHGRLSKEYIRSVVHEATPLIRECYEMALEEDRDLAGTLRARFSIAGEADVGGLVETVDVEADDGLAVSATLVECMRETVYSLQFDPPEGGGRVDVTYPFIFRTSGDE
jgi:hypothetical protein